MKFIALLLVGLAVSLVAEATPTNSVALPLPSIRLAAHKFINHVQSVTPKRGPGHVDIHSDDDNIGRLIDWLRTRDWNGIIDTLDESLRSAKVHIQTGVDGVKALEVSQEVLDQVLSELPELFRAKVSLMTPEVIASIKSIYDWQGYFQFSDPMVAFLSGALTVYVYGLYLPTYVLHETMELFNSLVPGLGSNLSDVIHQMYVDVFIDIITVFNAIVYS